MAILMQADEKDVMEMMEDASIDMKKPHRNPFLKAWKAHKAAAEVSCCVDRDRERTAHTHIHTCTQSSCRGELLDRQTAFICMYMYIYIHELPR